VQVGCPECRGGNVDDEEGYRELISGSYEGGIRSPPSSRWTRSPINAREIEDRFGHLRYLNAGSKWVRTSGSTLRKMGQISRCAGYCKKYDDGSVDFIPKPINAEIELI